MIPIHAAKIFPSQYVFLYKNETHFEWFMMNPALDQAVGSGICGVSLSEVLHLGYRHWEKSYFRLIQCGFRYALPERDQVGSNALFWQMALSYNSSNGRYFDEEVGHLCYVDFASEEALRIWRTIRSHKTLADMTSSKS